MKDQRMPLTLNARLRPELLRLLTSFVEESAKAYGMNEADALKLTLACEEIFVYLCRTGQTDEAVTVEASNGGYFVGVKFSFKSQDFNPRAFNLTASVSLEDAAGLEEMGLLIASRTVERFTILQEPQKALGLVLIKEKSYPDLAGLKPPETIPIKNFRIDTPDPDRLKLFARLVTTCYPGRLSLPAFLLPGKVVDMVGSGEYGAKIASDEKGRVAGGLLWRWVGTKTVESFGPYVFNQPHEPDLPEALINGCLAEIAKTEAIGLVSRYSTPELPKGYFESLGSVDLFQTDGSVEPRPVVYRQLREDPGCRVWAHPCVGDFLRSEYGRLFFGREIQLTRYGGEQRPVSSVFAPEFDRTNRQITLRPVWDGSDTAENLSRHLKVLRAENLPNIFFEIDLGHPWQAGLSQTLLDLGFRPRLILPYSGESDVILFQYQGSG